MYLLIEHDGTVENTDLASKLKDLAEDEYGATCEFIVGNTPEISILDENQKELIRFNGQRSLDELRFVLNFINEDEDELRDIQAAKLRQGTGNA